jgi:hypothetical protein
MNAIKIETTIQTDGQLHLTQLPCPKGDRVEAIVLLVDRAASPPGTDDTAESEKRRQEALERFQARADASRFRSAGPYHMRDELHESW